MVYQFHGCYWHGCQKCYKPDDLNKEKNKLMIDLYNETNEISNKLKNAGYVLEEFWECQYDRICKAVEKCNINKLDEKNKRNAIILKENNANYDLEYFKHIKPRDSFSGGRTNAVKLYYKVDESTGEVIRYVDITSLYPWVNYICKYPIGEPIIIKENFDYSLNSYFGLVKCHVIPNKNLYHPVLWHHDHENNDKLMFDLNDKIGTWTTEELKLAISKGYIIDKIYEVWHFEESTTELFKSSGL